MKTIAVTSVYANPIHPGHIECFKLSKDLSDELWVIVNNDAQARLKRGTESFQDEQFRANIVSAIKHVDKVVVSIDTDHTVCLTLELVFKEIKKISDDAEIIFTKGGDRFASEIPERTICERYGVRIVDGLGAKTHSSSSYVGRLSQGQNEEGLTRALSKVPPSAQEKEYIEVGYRPWGVYYVLEDRPDYKVKKIIVTSGHRLSLQSHRHRSEHWVVVSGKAQVEIRDKDDAPHTGHRTVGVNESCFVPKGHLHRISNPHSEPLVIIEVQSGEYTGEDDIMRYEDDYARSS
jgi:mannose-6-phosphate isomerase